ncbi:MAG TPA: phosphoribosyltransferase family protein [Candidatus Deferrimicrobium sp.]|nr:phosphoribosyltransferase family protein [Candidatus Deferrimicrobium sp.]
MNITTLPAYLPNTYKFDILDDLKIEIEVTHNPFALSLQALFAMAARQNPKRSFLFVSKILGKHLPVDPSVSLLGGALLAYLYNNLVNPSDIELEPTIAGAIFDQQKALGLYSALQQQPFVLEQPTLFIGFAETATALGHSMFNCFAKGAHFIQTTRDLDLDQKPQIRFAEEHSHAVAHYCYGLERGSFVGDKTVVLVDDEITTGKTALNIIREIQASFPKQEYVVASLLDWRSDEDKQRFKQLEAELDIKIRTISLLSGKITVTGKLKEEKSPLINTNKEIQKAESKWKQYDFPYLGNTGRFGLSCEDKEELENYIIQVAEYLRQGRQGKRILCLGNGEFMYHPMRIASHMGPGVFFQSTTRSPIKPAQNEGYIIQSRLVYPSPDDPAVSNYLYNVPHGHYDELYMFLEREVSKERITPLLKALNTLGVPRCFIVVCGSSTLEGSNYVDCVNRGA